jgi:phosphate transport system permease protein
VSKFKQFLQKLKFWDKKEADSKLTAECLQDVCFEDLPRRNRVMNPETSQKTAFGLLASSGVLVFAILALFLGYIIVQGIRFGFTPNANEDFPFNFKLQFRFMFDLYNAPVGVYGFFPAIIGTAFLIIGTVVIAFPLGLLAAIYLCEYTRGGRLIAIIDQGINNLAGVPSVVVGLFGFTFFLRVLGMQKSLWAGMLTLACMILPTIIRTSQEAIRSVPDEYREGSFALGATKWRTIRYVVLPSAAPGIVTGVILSLGRAAGETAAVMFVGAAVFGNFIFLGFNNQFAHLPYWLFKLYDSEGISTAGPAMWLISFVLMSIVLLFSFFAMRIRNRAEKRRAGM